MQQLFISDIKWSYIFSYFGKSKSLFRHYQEKVLEMSGSWFKGDIIELGGEKHYNVQRFFKNNKLIVSNIDRDYDMYIDITKIPLEADSVENYIMISMLQHVKDPLLAIKEVKRTLKPNGKILVVNAFTHPVCDEKDYWRFGEEAYKVLFKDGFEIEKVFYLGGNFSMMSNTFRRPIGNIKFRYLIYKSIGFIISILGKIMDRKDLIPIGIGVLVRKK